MATDGRLVPTPAEGERAVEGRSTPKCQLLDIMLIIGVRLGPVEPMRELASTQHDPVRLLDDPDGDEVDRVNDSSEARLAHEVFYFKDRVTQPTRIDTPTHPTLQEPARPVNICNHE